MFYKGKRRRRLIAFAQAEPGASSSDGLAELAHIAASFEPVRYELGNSRLNAYADTDEPHSPVPAREFTVSEGSAGERIYHFGCYAADELPAGIEDRSRRFPSATVSRKD
jgi:hypothetical protein